MARKKWKFTRTELQGFYTTLTEVGFDVHWIGVADDRMIAGKTGRPGEAETSVEASELEQWIERKKKRCA